MRAELTRDSPVNQLRLIACLSLEAVIFLTLFFWHEVYY